MGLPSWADDTITLVTYPFIADHGQQVPDMDAEPVRTAVNGCSVQPAGGATDEAHRDATSASYVVYAPPYSLPTELRRTLIELPGVSGLFRVEGELRTWRSPTGMTSHEQITVNRWEG